MGILPWTIACSSALLVVGCARIAALEEVSRKEAPATEEDAGSDASPAPTSSKEPEPPPGRWFQVDGADCAAFCADKGLENVPSPDGAKCTSGENIPQSALDAKISYDHCYPGCTAHVAGENPQSHGRYCYADDQKQDGDPSDVTRGCFCR